MPKLANKINFNNIMHGLASIIWVMFLGIFIFLFKIGTNIIESYPTHAIIFTLSGLYICFQIIPYLAEHLSKTINWRKDKNA